MKFRHIAFVIAVFPLVGLSYACSKSNSHSGDNPWMPTPSPGGSDADDIIDDGGDADAGVNSDTDTIGASDTDTGGTGDTDPGDPGEHLVTCVGNPLTADGETPSGGAVVDSALTLIYDEFAAVAGPKYLEIDGRGKLIYSAYTELVSLDLESNERTVIRNAPTGSYFFGNAIENDTILTIERVGTIPTTGAVVQTKFDGTVVGDPIPTSPSSAPRALAVGPKGDVYFTDDSGLTLRTSGLYRISPERDVTTILSSLNYFEGIALSPGADKLYVVLGTADRGVWAQIAVWPIDADGSVVSPSTTFATLTYTPAALAFDTGGNLWVAGPDSHATTTSTGLIEVFAPDGTRYGEITLPANMYPSGIAFGGADNQTVFITATMFRQEYNSVYTYQARCAGIR